MLGQEGHDSYPPAAALADHRVHLIDLLDHLGPALGGKGKELFLSKLAAAIRKHTPSYEVCYAPDFRQAVTDSWPASIADNTVRTEWGRKPDYDLAAMTKDILAALRKRHAVSIIGA